MYQLLSWLPEQYRTVIGMSIEQARSYN